MSRPGAWMRVLTNLKKYITKDFSEKVYIGQDSIGNKFYEIKNTRQNVNRGYEAAPGVTDKDVSVEWHSWLKGTRRFPPNDQEILINRQRQQAQLAGDAQTEKKAPQVHSEGPGANEGPRHYPKYSDMEVNPGAPPPNKN